MEERTNRSSSPTSLSDPPSALSEPGSPPARFINQGRANIEMDEIVVDPGSAARLGLLPGQSAPAVPPGVKLTAAGLPRKKPGRKPKVAVDGDVPSPAATDAPKKTRRPRKPRDPDAPPIQRKRKATAIEAGEGSTNNENRPFPGAAVAAATARQPPLTELTSMRLSLDAPRSVSVTGASATASTGSDSYSVKMPKRESMPASMNHILNSDEPPHPRPQPPTPTPALARQIFDPVRGNYDPVRETMIARDPYGTGSLGSPRAPTSSAHRASASPSIASLVDPTPSTAQHLVSPQSTHQTYSSTNNHSNKPTLTATLPPRFHESTSMPPSPSQAAPRSSQSQSLAKPPKPSVVEVKHTPVPLPPQPSSKSMDPPKNSFTSMSSIPAGGLGGAPTSAPAQIKKGASVAQKEREKHKSSTSSSSPNVTSVKDGLPGLAPASGRSILDFGKANPGESKQTPSIVLHIPLNGESNKVVNFMRMAEEAYGWDALHPRLAAHRERKARIAAASAELAKQGSGRESGDDEMSVDESDNDVSNVEMGGVANGAGGPASGPDGAPVKAKRKRVTKEDEYDKDDDFVDDSEMLWEEQAAASRDGFFVYSGPLIPEVEKPPAGEAPAKRGRGGGRGSRGGGRGGAARGEGTGRGRGGGPGSRGGTTTRKPRITKAEKAQREAEKEERERMALMTSKAPPPAAGPYNLNMPLGQGPAAGMTS